MFEQGERIFRDRVQCGIKFVVLFGYTSLPLGSNLVSRLDCSENVENPEFEGNLEFEENPEFEGIPEFEENPEFEFG